jgi:hypothetical protein
MTSDSTLYITHLYDVLTPYDTSLKAVQLSQVGTARQLIHSGQHEERRPVLAVLTPANTYADVGPYI